MFTCATVVSWSYWHLQKMQAIKESIQGLQKRAPTAAAKPLPKRHKALKPAVADKLGNASDDIDIEDIASFTAQETIQAKLCTSLLLAASVLKSCAHLVLATTICSVYWYKDSGTRILKKSLIASCFCQIRQELLAWYDKHHRVLPWRRNPHSLRQPESDDKYHSAALDMPQQQFAYCVWVCEVMSQQTQVSRVAEYFTRWIQKWPTVQVTPVIQTKACNACHPRCKCLPADQPSQQGLTVIYIQH